MKNAVVVRKGKNLYAPMADAMKKACEELDVNFKNRREILNNYDNLLLFDNKISRVNKPLKVKNKAKMAWWMNDLRSVDELCFPHELNADIGSIFLCNRQHIDEYKERFKLPVYYMPQHGHELPTFAGRDFGGNIVFIGKVKGCIYHSNRENIIKRLWNLGVKHIQMERFTIDMGYIYKTTPISLSVSLPVEEYNSNRLYNIIASQGFALTAYCPGLEKQFENHKHIVWFKSVDEAYSLAKYYLKHKKDRNKIAANGHKLFLEKHRAKHRLQNIFDIMEGRTESFYGYL